MVKSSIKPIVLLVVAMLFLQIVPTPAYPASRVIIGFSGDKDLEDMFSLGQSGEYHSLTVRPGDEIRIPLTADMFEWSDGRSPLPNEELLIREARDGKLKVKMRTQAGHMALDYAQLDYDYFTGRPFYASGTSRRTSRTAMISVMFAEELVRTEDLPFRFRLILQTRDGAEMELTISGDMVVEVEVVDNDSDSIDISEGIVVEAKEFVKEIELDLGNGLTITRSLSKRQRYYGTCDIKDSEAMFQEEFSNIYPVVAGVYKLNTVNLNSGRSKVKIDPSTWALEKRDYFVYNQDLEFLGTINDILPFSVVYVLTTEELETFSMEDYEGSLTSAPNQERVQEADAEILEEEAQAYILAQQEAEAEQPSLFDAMDDGKIPDSELEEYSQKSLFDYMEDEEPPVRKPAIPDVADSPSIFDQMKDEEAPGTKQNEKPVSEKSIFDYMEEQEEKQKASNAPAGLPKYREEDKEPVFKGKES